jgi:hypothetical protein
MNRFTPRFDYGMGWHCFVTAVGRNKVTPRMKPISAFGEGIAKRLIVKELANELQARPRNG